MSTLRNQLIKLAYHKPKLRPHLLPILKEAKPKYYWAAKEEGEVPVGFEVPPARFLARFQEQEEIFERVRREKYPDRPSRIGARFICPDQRGFCGGRWGQVYEVEIAPDAKVFQTNAEYWTEAVYRDNPEDKASYAESYWKGTDNAPFFPEILVQGKVTVLRKVKS